MAFCSTWSSSSHFRHPWFDNPVPKRKQPESEQDDSQPQKRFRLESGFAHLSLDSSSSSSSSSSSPQNVTDIPEEPMDMDPVPLSSEEPVIPEVNMKTSSWYEPEPDRIVITDLDSYTNEDDEEGEASEQPISVNSALLNHIKNQTLDKTRSKTVQPPPPSPSQALVLFKPLPLPTSSETPPQTNQTTQQSKPTTVDENAMDIEL
ncbi:hypothetical protein CVT24_009735 [Panaeolus cyanescens]|uniref:Uncharacterized protein n=1 Tax=Panaeolus cyanescens TaxID=181874 RepID=A0A409Y9F2_9AGAR|nr:hypothetical protein CVT24_009735 [Panaeolus cyanescens]